MADVQRDLNSLLQNTYFDCLGKVTKVVGLTIESMGPEAKLNDVCEGLNMLISLPDPVGRVTLNRELDEGLLLKRISCPIGVIGVIFEARPDALVQIASLCIKSGNCALLKGGKETADPTSILFQLIHESVVCRRGRSVRRRRTMR